MLAELGLGFEGAEVGAWAGFGTRSARLARSADQWSIDLSFELNSKGFTDGLAVSWHERHCFSLGSTKPTNRANSASFMTNFAE